MEGKSRLFYAPIFLISLATLLLEISYTRIFSFKIYYYFTYLILGVALMGLGAGGVAVALSSRLREATDRWLPPLSVATALAVAGGYILIALAPLNASRIAAEPLEIVKLLAVIIILTLPFLGAGVSIALILSAGGRRVNRLYAADLVGAALACAISIPLMYALGPPACIMASGLLFAIAGVSMQTSRRVRFTGAAAAVLLGLAVLMPSALPDARVDVSKRLDQFREASDINLSVWNPVFRIDVAENPFQRHALLLFHDGRIGSTIQRNDGDPDALSYLDRDLRSLPSSALGPGPTVLVIGAAGGHEVLSSLYFGASRVVGVELNPGTVDLLTGPFAEYSGRLAEDPRVSLVNDEGRSFLRRTPDRYDLIWFVAPDSYAAMNAASAGSFVMSESYLYTVEAIRDALDRLTPDGLIVTAFGEMNFEERPKRTIRYLTTARQAFAEAGIDDFGRHVIVSTSQGLFTACTIALSRVPFSRERIEAYRDQLARVDEGQARYLPGEKTPAHPLHAAIELDSASLERWVGDYPHRVDPVRDDSPFFWHFTRFRNAARATRYLGFDIVDYEESVGELLLLVLLVVVTVVAGVLLLLPFVSVRAVWAMLPYKGYAALYFAALGLGFMLLEVSLIQLLTLLLGYPTYSLSVTLLSLLLFAGIGSLVSETYQGNRNRALAGLFAITALMTIFYAVGLPRLIEVAGGASLALRIALTVGLIAPLGFALGAYFPLGLATIAAWAGPHEREYIAWSWAINGFFSVIASVLATILAMSFGFRFVLLLALGVYAIGVAALAAIPTRAPVVRP